MDIKPIETRYKGYKFRSRLEAKWAVFFDACGIDWDYEPEGYDLGDGIYYLPDFVLHNVKAKGFSGDLYVEVKGHMTEEDELKIEKFYEVFSDNNELPVSKKPLLVVGNIPYGKDIFDLYYDTMDIKSQQQTGCHLYFSYVPIMGLHYETIFGIGKNKKPRLIYFSNCDCFFNINEKATIEAYQKAREARFEHGESPE